jgi:hypothetical protein
MAYDDLIEKTLRQLEARLIDRVDVVDLIDEISDHLLTSRDLLAAQGLDSVEATRAALDHFGDTDEVAASMTVGFKRRFAVPTPFTRFGGWLAGVGALAWLVMLGGWWLSLRIEADSGWSSESETAYVVGAVGLFSAGLSNAVVIAALRRRLGGLGRSGAIGLSAAMCAAVAAVFGWMTYIWAPLLAVATATIAIPVLRSGRAPKWPMLAFAASWTVSAAALLLDRSLGVTTSAWRDMVWLSLGGAVAAVASVVLWQWLANERPTALPGIQHI